MVDFPAELFTFASLSREEGAAWIERRQEENRQRRLAECEANGAHVLACGERECPHCGTPYVEALG